MFAQCNSIKLNIRLLLRVKLLFRGGSDGVVRVTWLNLNKNTFIFFSRHTEALLEGYIIMQKWWKRKLLKLKGVFFWRFAWEDGSSRVEINNEFSRYTYRICSSSMYSQESSSTLTISLRLRFKESKERRP